MFKESSVFTPPENPNGTIWKYMSFQKFVCLLETQSLFYARADQMEDRFEGSIPIINSLVRTSTLKQEGIPDEIINSDSKTRELFTHYTYLNCWNKSDFESAALWKAYSVENNVISIQSNYNNFKDSIIDTNYDEYLGMVKYIDYVNEYISNPYANIMTPFLFKRKSFEHENELRSIICLIKRRLLELMFRKDCQSKLI